MSTWWTPNTNMIHFFVFGISHRLSYNPLRHNHWLGRHIDVIFATQCQLIDKCYIGCYLYLPHHPGKTCTVPKWSASLCMRPKTSTSCMTDLWSRVMGFSFVWGWTKRQYPCCMYSLVELNPMFINPSELTRFIPLSYFGFILENHIGVLSVA